MDSTLIIMGVIVATLALSLIGLLVMMNKQKKKSKAAEYSVRSHSAAKHRNYLGWFYNFFRSAPYLNKYFFRVRGKVKALYPSDIASINRKTTQILIKGTAVGIIGVILSFIIAKTDIFYMLCGFLITYLLVTTAVTGSFKKMEESLLHQTSEAITKMRHHYHTSGIVDAALAATIEQSPYEIGLHLQNILNIVRSPNMSEMVDEYIGSEPNQFMLMLLQICTSIKEFGDKKLENGSSLFLTDINYLKEEINNEIIGIRKNATAFRALAGCAIAPIVMVKPLEAWARTNMPEIATYYEGIYGIVAVIVIFIVSVACYELITSLRDGTQISEKNTNMFTPFTEIPAVKHVLNQVINKNYTKYEKINDDMKALGDHTGPKAFILQRVAFFVAAVVMVIFIGITADITQRAQYLNKWANAFEESMAPNAEYKSNMEYVAKQNAHIYIDYVDISEAALSKQILADDNGIDNAVYADEVAQKVVARLGQYKKTYFKFWYLIIAIIVGFIAFNIPIWVLKFRRNVIEMRKEEEIVQFQSLILILMHINGTTVSTILEWMERFSYCFRESITKCRLSLNKGTQLALEEMKIREMYEPFRDMADNLLAVDKVGVEKAFDEILTDREYYKKKREQDLDEAIQKRSDHAKKLVLVPFGCVFALYLIVPLGMYAINMFKTFSETIGM